MPTLKQYIEQNTHAPFDPVAAGVMQPRAALAPKRVRDKSRIEESEGGDAHLRGLAASARSKQTEKEVHVLGVQARKEERVEKKARLESSAAAQLEAFNACQPVCTCGMVPCPWANMHHCPHCGDIKKTVCRKKACGPLLLTMVPPALPAPTA